MEETFDPRVILQQLRDRTIIRTQQRNLYSTEGQLESWPSPQSSYDLNDSASYVACIQCASYQARAGKYDLIFVDSLGDERSFFGVPGYLCLKPECYTLLLDPELFENLGGAALGRCRFAIASDLELLR